jgi:hypothetical protein
LPRLKCLLFNIFLVFSRSTSNSHAKTLSFGQSLEFQIHQNGAGGSTALYTNL